MIDTAHGKADPCLVLADTKKAHGRVPAVATARPLTTARTRTGRRTQSGLTFVSRRTRAYASCL
jgi:hypothetical protein